MFKRKADRLKIYGQNNFDNNLGKLVCQFFDQKKKNINPKQMKFSL